MRSSTSSFESAARSSRDSRTPARAIVLLLALIAIFLVSVEIFSRYGVTRLSKIESREEREYAVAVGAKPANGRRTLLLMGNSLMGDGVRFEEVRDALAPAWDVRRLYVDDTAYWDFYYAIRRLYAEGARYSVVAVFLTPRQLSLPGVRGDYFAYRLMLTSDIFRVARDTRLHRTEASNMFFASVSAFYGLRAEIRKVLLGRLMPGLPALMRLLTSNRAAPLADEQIYRGALVNLRAYSKLAASQNSRIILVLPPQTELEGVAMTKLAALQAGITVVSVSPDVTGPSDFRDGFHLNAVGAGKYTAALIPAIAKALR